MKGLLVCKGVLIKCNNEFIVEQCAIYKLFINLRVQDHTC